MPRKYTICMTPFGKKQVKRYIIMKTKTRIILLSVAAAILLTVLIFSLIYWEIITHLCMEMISGVEIRLRELGRRLNISKVHPHKFRRTLATRAIDKGMPIEQVQQLLGHQKIDTTLEYAMVNQNNVKMSHRKFIA